MAAVGAVILAAGGSSRFGRPKQLVEFRGRTLIANAVAAAKGAGCAPIVLVTGSSGGAVVGPVRDESIIVFENSNWSNGIGTSIRGGVQHLIESHDADAVVLLVCDQPLVSAEIVSRLIGRWTETRKPIVASSYSNTLGVPALFYRSCFDELLRLDGDTGAKPIIFADGDRVAEVPFPEGACDIDTIQDYESLMSK